MKIALLYAYWENEQWSPYMGFRQELERRGHQIVDFNLYHDDGVIYRKGSARKYSIQGLVNMKQAFDDKIFVPDVVLHFDYGVFDHPALDKKHFPGTTWILESGDDPQAFRRNYQKVSKFDAVMTPDYQCAEIYEQNGHNAYWMAHCADTTVYYPMNEIDEQYNCVTTSSVPKELRDLLGDSLYGTSLYRGPDHAKFINSGKIVFECSQNNEITPGIFDAMACGKLVVTNRLPEHTRIQELFKDNEDIIFYDNTEDAADKIRYYAEHDTERTAIAQRGMEKVWEYHSTAARVDKLFDIIDETNAKIVGAY